MKNSTVANAKPAATPAQVKPVVVPANKTQIASSHHADIKTPVIQKNAPLPMHKIEQARNLSAGILKEIPLEVEAKAQSVAI